MKKVIAEGALTMNENGRYAINGEVELTSGMVVEVLDNFKWVRTSIEWDEFYYFDNLEVMEKRLEGAWVRLSDF